MKDRGWMMNDERWMMNDERWMMKDDDFKLFKGFSFRQMNKWMDEQQTDIVIVELLLQLKILGFLQDNSICNSQRVFNVSKRLIYNYLSFCILSAKIIC